MSETEKSHFSLLQKKALEMLSYAGSYCAIASLSSLLYHLLPAGEYTVLEKPLMRMLNGPEHYRQIGLNMMVAVLEKNGTAFDHSLRYLRLTITDTEYCKHRKLDILKLMANEGNIKWIQKELDYWIGSENLPLACKCIGTIGDIAVRNSSIEVPCVRSLILLLKSGESEIVAAAVISLRKLLYKV